ncbi:Aste57867_25385 [Aphanomyces stellatus]|uniref:HECT-type E3 ubiquitin transferase n=1 Tax=Aphanomyces stellatus TaxID=120398 RepID=A0A485LXQ3_9STRA|nr:hypothetical protein As57867_025306 [Aphanomyces stellatus]VFU02010.1 Aste57867_25385 [Aphanomyces stellatus]
MTKITLLGESAIDAGGVTREWCSVLSLANLDPEQGLFITNKTDLSFINPNSAKDHGSNHLESAAFPNQRPAFQGPLGQPVSIEDIRSLDAVVYSSLVFVRDCTNDVAELALTFSATLDASTEVDLVPNGQAIEVTCANKAEYIERMVQYLLFDRVTPQLEKMVQGLYDVLPQELLMPFDYKELELLENLFLRTNYFLVWRSSDILWGRCTTVSAELEKVADWFGDLVEFDLTPSQREKLLQFTTGSSRVDSVFVWCVSQSPLVLNRIDLPVHSTRELLREGIFVLITMDDVEFTLA